MTWGLFRPGCARWCHLTKPIQGCSRRPAWPLKRCLSCLRACIPTLQHHVFLILQLELAPPSASAGAAGRAFSRCETSFDFHYSGVPSQRDCHYCTLFARGKCCTPGQEFLPLPESSTAARCVESCAVWRRAS